MYAFRSLSLVLFVFTFAFAESLTDRVLLSDVEALTLYKNVNTTHRRLPAIPQVLIYTINLIIPPQQNVY